MTFGDVFRAINCRRFGTGFQNGFIRAQAHGSAQISVFMTYLFRSVFIPFRHQADNSFAVFIQFGRIGVFDAENIAHSFNNGHLHSKTNSQKRNIMFTRIFDGGNFPGRPAQTKPAGDQNPADVGKQG